MKIQESGENYLETILLLEGRNGSVRSVDIANELDYTKPSISRAMGVLKKAGLVTVGGNGQILLTDLGRSRANEIYSRHRLITRYLCLTLGLEESVAEEDACRIEHVVSPETVEHIRAFVEGKEGIPQ